MLVWTRPGLYECASDTSALLDGASMGDEASRPKQPTAGYVFESKQRCFIFSEMPGGGYNGVSIHMYIVVNSGDGLIILHMHELAWIPTDTVHSLEPQYMTIHF